MKSNTRMEINLDFAQYVLSLQRIKIMEGGEDDYDIGIRNKIEDSFPEIKKAREKKEFEDWVFKQVHEDPDVLKALNEINDYIEKKHTNWLDAGVDERMGKLDLLKEKLFKQFLKDKKTKERYDTEKMLQKLEEKK